MKWSIKRAAAEFGVSAATIKRGLVASGIEVRRGVPGSYATRQVVAAIFGDLKLERTREVRARADLLELERRALEGETMKVEEARAQIRSLLVPVRQAVLGLPAEMGARCNPADPEFAASALKVWVDETLRAVRKEIADGK
jgi:hypothetical protein